MAANSIAKMAVQLVANSAGFAAGLSPGRAAIKSMQKDLHSFAGTARIAFAGIGAYIGISAIRRVAGEILNTSNRMEDLVNQSALIGASPKEFLALGFAADKVGVSAEAVNTGLRMMMKNLSGVGEEGKKASEAARLIGTTPESLRAAGPGGALMMIAQGMEKYSDSFTRAGIATAFFGKNWSGLMPLFAQGSAGIRAMIEEGRGLTGMFTDDDVQRVADYNDSIDRLRLVMLSFKVKALSIITPDLIELAENFTAKLQTVGPEFWEGVKTKFQDIVALSGQIVEHWRNIAEKAVIAYSTWKGAAMGAAIGGPWGALLGGALGFGAGGALTEAPGKIAGLGGGITDTNMATGGVPAGLFPGKSNWDVFGENLRKWGTEALAGQAPSLGPDEKESASIIKDYAESIKDLADDAIGARERFGMLNSVISDLQADLDDGLITWEDYGEAVESATDKFYDSFRSMQEFLTTPQEKMQSKMDTLNFMFEQGMIAADKYEYGQAKLWEEMTGGAEKYGDQINNVVNLYEDLNRALEGGQQAQSLAQITGRMAGARVSGVFGGGMGAIGGYENMAFPDMAYRPAGVSGGYQRAQHAWDARSTAQYGARASELSKWSEGRASEEWWSANARPSPLGGRGLESNRQILAYLARIAQNTGPDRLVPQGVLQ